MNPEKCECHECTQARWKSSVLGQITGALSATIPQSQAMVEAGGKPLRPTYFVKHPDGSYSEADPQP